MSRMSDQDKARLKQIPRPRCFVCGSVRHYTNPVEKCFECKKRFCYEHLWGGQVNEEMKENDEVKKVCEKCRKEFNYYSL